MSGITWRERDFSGWPGPWMPMVVVYLMDVCSISYGAEMQS
jgi:hypothetical protein